MIHIPTTATAVQKLKRLAKSRRKSHESLRSAQDAVAREHGYHDWKHVTVCEKASASRPASQVVLPEAIERFLAQERASRPASQETAHALASGLLFALDVKEALEMRPQRNPEIQECDDAAPFLASDIWLASMRRELEEGGGKEGLAWEPERELEFFLEDMANYRFFRYEGPSAFKGLEEAFAGPFRDFFFAPTHVWLAGKFFDMGDVREVRVDGKTVYASTPEAPGRPATRSYRQPAGAAPTSPSIPIVPASEGIIARADVRRLQASLYEVNVSRAGQELFSEGGFSSIADALRWATDVTGPIKAYEVAYGGVVEGTYLLEDLASSAQAVAARAVELVASLRDR